HGRPVSGAGCQTVCAKRSGTGLAKVSAVCRARSCSRFTANAPQPRSAWRVSPRVVRQTDRIGGSAVTLARDVQVRPRGRPSGPWVVTTATPAGKVLISDRKSLTGTGAGPSSAVSHRTGGGAVRAAGDRGRRL